MTASDAVTATQQPSAESGDHRTLIVTIDGPAGTGKSSVARALAKRFGLEYLDTGAMYRAVAALVIDRGVSFDDEGAIARLAEDAALRFNWASDPPEITGFGASLQHRLREADVDTSVSRIAAMPGVREALVREQRRIGAEHPRLVTEGRDQGSVVFPRARLKVFLDASACVRARRRADQLAGRGIEADTARIEREIIERDRLDASRSVGPLTRPTDAVSLDTSELGFGEVVDTLEQIVRERVSIDVLERRGE